MCLYLQEIDTPLIKVNAAYSSSSGYDAKRHDEKDDGVISHATSEFDLTMTIRHMSQEEALAPLRMTQLQTNYITKTMVRKSYAASSSSSNSNIGHYKRQKTETLEHANNNRSSRHSNTDDSDSGDNNEDEGAYYEEHEECYGGSTSFSDDNDDDDDSVSSMPTLTTSLALLPRPSFDILNELETHSKTIQLVASAGGLITHCE